MRAAALPDRVRALVRMHAAPQFHRSEKSEEKEAASAAVVVVAVEGTDAEVEIPPPTPAFSSFPFSTLDGDAKGTGPATRGARSSFDIDSGAESEYTFVGASSIQKRKEKNRKKLVLLNWSRLRRQRHFVFLSVRSPIHFVGELHASFLPLGAHDPRAPGA